MFAIGVAAATAVGVPPVGAGVVEAQPDVLLEAVAPDPGPEIGDDVYLVVNEQSATFDLEDGEKAKALVHFENDSSAPDKYRVGAVPFLQGAVPRALAGQVVQDYTIRYRRPGGKDITEKVAAGKLKYRDVQPGETKGPLRVIVKLADEPSADVLTLGVVVHATSKNDRTVQDFVFLDVRPAGLIER